MSCAFFDLTFSYLHGMAHSVYIQYQSRLQLTTMGIYGQFMLRFITRQNREEDWASVRAIGSYLDLALKCLASSGSLYQVDHTSQNHGGIVWISVRAARSYLNQAEEFSEFVMPRDLIPVVQGENFGYIYVSHCFSHLWGNLTYLWIASFR